MPLFESRRANILVADDQPHYREMLTELLEDEGYRVMVASDGEQALEVIEREPVDVALIDVMMPRKNGFDVCQELQSRPETKLLPVVLITGLNAVSDRILGIKCGAGDFLSKPFSREELLARVRSLLKLKLYTDELEHAETVLFTLARSIEEKDAYTKGHCARLSNYSERLAEHLGLPEPERIALRRAGVVHDIGKVAVPESILGKPGPLTPEERRIMQEHPATGERICAPLKSFRLVLPIIRHHHERLDGKGYPDGLSGEDIPLTARIMSVVDVYDALTSDRPYRKAVTSQEAFSILREEAARNWLDSSLVNTFEEMMRRDFTNSQTEG